MFPAPPKAPLDSWKYAPHAAIVARVEIADGRLGYRESRRIALLAPIANGALDLSHATEFHPDDFHHGPVDGAAFVSMDDALLGARSIKAMEKMLRDHALSQARAIVLTNTALDLVSSPGETPEAFAARCAELARTRAAEDEAALVRKHDPKIQKLAAQRDIARSAAAQAEASVPAGAGVVGVLFGTRRSVDRAEAQRDRAIAKIEKLREKAQEADMALAEAVAERNAKIAARRAELATAPSATTQREVVAKKDALTIEGYAIAWVAV